MGTAVVTGIANGVLGAALARQSRVPMETGTEPTATTPPRVARLQRAIGVLGSVNIASGVLLVADNALFRRGAFGRPATRRAITRSGDGNTLQSLLVGAAAGVLAGAGNELRHRFGS